MPEIQQPDIVGNYLGSLYQAQDRVQKQQDRQRAMQRQDVADQQQAQQFQWTKEQHDAATKADAISEVVMSLKPGDVQGFEAAKQQLLAKGVLTPQEAATLDPAKLQDYQLQSEKWRQIKAFQLQQQQGQAQIEASRASTQHSLAATQALREKPPAGVDPNTGVRLAPPGLQGRDSSTLAKFSEQADAAGSIAATLQGIKPQLDKGMTGPGLSNRRAVAGALSYLPDFGLDGGTTTDYVNTADAIDQASKTIGIDTLQKMGGSDTERELLTAIQTTVNKDLLPRENWRRYNNSIAAADILSKKAQLASEWVNRFGSLSYAAPDGTTWQGFWPQYQKQAWAQHRQRMAQAEKEFDSKGGRGGPAASSTAAPSAPNSPTPPPGFKVIQ